jgi:hypothetical protein
VAFANSPRIPSPPPMALILFVFITNVFHRRGSVGLAAFSRRSWTPCLDVHHLVPWPPMALQTLWLSATLAAVLLQEDRFAVAALFAEDRWALLRPLPRPFAARSSNTNLVGTQLLDSLRVLCEIRASRGASSKKPMTFRAAEEEQAGRLLPDQKYHLGCVLYV